MLELQVNWEKRKFSPVQRISFLGMELNSVNLTARLSLEHAQSMLNCLESLQSKEGSSTETLSEAPGAYGICSHGHAARTASYETASALTSRPGHGVGHGQEGRGPASIFGRRFVPRIRTG